MPSNAYFVTEALDDPNKSDEFVRINDVEFQIQVARHSAMWRDYEVTVRIQVKPYPGWIVSHEISFQLCRHMYENCQDVVWDRLVDATQPAGFDTWQRLLVYADAPAFWQLNNEYDGHNPHELLPQQPNQLTQSLEVTRERVREFVKNSILWVSEPGEQVEGAYEDVWDSIQPFTWTFQIIQKRINFDEPMGHEQALAP
jgi:hypothetical protein